MISVMQRGVIQSFHRGSSLAHKVGLQIKANLENVTNLLPSGDDFRWYLKLKCIHCGEETGDFVYLCLLESQPLKGGRGSASLVIKCKLCSRENSIDIMKDSISSYSFESSEANKYHTVVTFDCRGIEPISFSPRVGWTATGIESEATFEVDLTQGDWVDYDEKANCSVGVYDVQHQFAKV